VILPWKCLQDTCQNKQTTHTYRRHSTDSGIIFGTGAPAELDVFNTAILPTVSIALNIDAPKINTHMVHMITCNNAPLMRSELGRLWQDTTDNV